MRCLAGLAIAFVTAAVASQVMPACDSDSGCKDDFDCAQAFVCKVSSSTCEPFVCKVDSDCDNGLSCDDNTCK